MPGYDSCGTQGCTYDGVSLFIYGACSTTQGFHAVILRVGMVCICWHNMKT